MLAKLNEEKAKQQEEECSVQPSSDPFVALKEKLAQAKKDGVSCIFHSNLQSKMTLHDLDSSYILHSSCVKLR